MSSDGQTPVRRTRVALVDDDALVRAGLGLILGGADDLEVVAEASDGIEAITAVATSAPDVVLMDIRMPRRDGLEATRMLLSESARATRRRPVRVIVLTTFDADDMVVQALRAGAHGFLLKDTEPQRIVEAVRLVAAGQPILSPSVVAQLMSHVAGTDDGGADDQRRREARARLSLLTEREAQVARAVGRGLSNAEISRELYLSIPTVKAHMSRVMVKLGADNRVQVAITVHDADLL